MPAARRASGLGLRPIPSLVFRLYWKKPSSSSFFLTSVCYTNATSSECYDVEKIKKLCCITYMVHGNVSGSVGNYPNYNGKCINVGLENPWKEKR